ncbi:formyltransferase family protein [Bradyrhizobium sp.]|uniref:formyltransferase family protein n=1 Tax=Bradyrhizobium sp. TaxID=376 RepID=UPI001E006AB1|nr:formyltransferase family protein [Bradyrhizobium sp.]MBI5321071.1 hypothetical protein [Bradyrhizobium sp.]
MKLVVFCDTLGQIPKFWKAFKGLGSKHELRFLICNNSRRSRWLFLAAQFAHAARRYSVWDWIGVVTDLWGGRIFLALDPLGSAASLGFLRGVGADLGLHAMGVIYRKEVIELCGKGILNAHIGQLPKFRGRSVMEWSVLCGDPTGVTVFFIDSGIDTGSPIVHWEPVPLRNMKTIAEAKALLFSKDAELYRKAVNKIEDGTVNGQNDVAKGRRFYEMSSLLRAVVQEHFEAQKMG